MLVQYTVPSANTAARTPHSAQNPLVASRNTQPIPSSPAGA